MEQSRPGCVSGQLEEYMMKRLKKCAIAIAAATMVLSPVAASAEPAIDEARTTSVVSGENNPEGASWIAIVSGLAIVDGGSWPVVDDDNDQPVSLEKSWPYGARCSE